MTSKSSLSMTQDAYEQLRQKLLSCEFRPGERLRIAELCTRFSVSQGIIREALSRLTAEGLVKAEPQRGFRVMPVSATDLWSLSTTRTEIEALCLRRAIEVGDINWESGIVAAFHQVTSMPRADRDNPNRLSEDFINAFGRFQNALIAACDNPWLMQVREKLFVQAQRYRRLSTPDEENLGDNLHRLMDDCLARDIPRATELLRHLMLARASALVKQLEVEMSDNGSGGDGRLTNTFGYDLESF